jgi:predicted Rossmann-fold nucleotide-binding protein
MTQPIRSQDVIVVEGEYGTVEEITPTYDVIQLWDWRRMVLP